MASTSLYIGLWGHQHLGCPFCESFNHLAMAQRSALRTGEIEGGAQAATLHYLTVTAMDARKLCRWIESLGQTAGLVFFLSLWNLFCDLLGSLPELSGHLNDAVGAAKMAMKEGNSLFVALCSLCQAVPLYHVGDYNG
jgi:hypothetical protein